MSAQASIFERPAPDSREFWIGIDPGVTGAIALVCERQALKVADMPTMAAGTSAAMSKKRMVDHYALAELIGNELQRVANDHDGDDAEIRVMVEKVTPMPSKPGKDGKRRDMGATSAFTFGQSYAACYIVPGVLEMPVEYVTPQAWKKHHRIAPGADKDAARTLAQRLYPAMAPELTLKTKGQARADAILIAQYGADLYSHSMGEPF